VTCRLCDATQINIAWVFGSERIRLLIAHFYTSEYNYYHFYCFCELNYSRFSPLYRRFSDCLVNTFLNSSVFPLQCNEPSVTNTERLVKVFRFICCYATNTRFYGYSYAMICCYCISWRYHFRIPNKRHCSLLKVVRLE
jgi:hypothetical protein